MKLNILLVEDESTIRSGFRKVLEDVIGGVHVAGEASNGREALEWLKSHTTDAVFTDIRMKEMNGIDLIKRLKEQSPALPVVIISGYNDFVYAREAIRYEAVDYLLKPVETAELAQVVERLKKRTLKGKPDSVPAEGSGGAPGYPQSEGIDRRPLGAGYLAAVLSRSGAFEPPVFVRAVQVGDRAEFIRLRDPGPDGKS